MPRNTLSPASQLGNKAMLRNTLGSVPLCCSQAALRNTLGSPWARLQQAKQGLPETPSRITINPHAWQMLALDGLKPTAN